MLKCGQRARDLVRQILLFSRTEDTGRTPLQLQQVAKEALSLLRATIPVAVEIKSDFEQAAPMVLANETQIHQVVLNLGINAAHAMEEHGGILAISVRRRIVDAVMAAEIPDLKPGLHVCLEVTDNGSGMEPEVAAHIFEPFFTTKKIGRGTGLGLAVVDSIVRSHQGAIRLTTKSGVGTTFELFFLAHEAGYSSNPAELSEIPRGRGQRILLVDDEPVITESTQIMLERLGYQVTASTSPAHALARFWAAPDDFDLLIADYQMPGMTGIALAKKMFAHRPALPVLIASGFAGSLTVENVRNEGIAEFLHKPMDSSDLGRTLAKMLP